MKDKDLIMAVLLLSGMFLFFSALKLGEIYIFALVFKWALGK